ncbi:putative actin-related protein 8 [Neolecta irregularis DAH-3]|uniref:Putative actin-related protein 8 n=1 Tax=Neolecta irregularis (strain DAH-3) TaxID=1198029 RepID=A0A1U7LNK9_NEOID|nr:putative actin-related protein 8 [Neolecta irregularis DAH-3]|eukprot:OLL24237.1 putative actin-related protein 8 [Neolecta irregularis DAH-3]
MPPKKKINLDGPEYNPDDYCFTSVPAIPAINQKNYYTEYLKKDDQFWVNRKILADLAEENARKAKKTEGNQDVAKSVQDDLPMEDEDDEDSTVNEQAGSRIIVIHPGSRNLRIGLASDAFPKTVPNVIARRVDPNTDPKDSEIVPKRINPDNPEGMFGESFEAIVSLLDGEVKSLLRSAKRRSVPNARELAAGYNKRSEVEVIPDHNDPNRVEWTDVSNKPSYVIGQKALSLPSNNAEYKLFWPYKHGSFNEQDYKTRRSLLGDIRLILEKSIEDELLIKLRDISQYSAVLIIPDLYDRTCIIELIHLLLREIGLSRVCIQQESVSVTFGAGISSACVVDIGAQKTSISCVDEGMCISDSRIDMKYGGDDITELFTKLLLRSSFPYSSVNLNQSHDWLLVEELKLKFCTTNEGQIAINLYQFFVRAPGEATRKFTFKVYDEVIMAPMSPFFPQSFERGQILPYKNTLFPISQDIYDNTTNEPEVCNWLGCADSKSLAQNKLLGKAVVAALSNTESSPAKQPAAASVTFTPASSMRGSPERELTPVVTQPLGIPLTDSPTTSPEYPIIPVDVAVAQSIQFASVNNMERLNRLYESIIVVGGSGMAPGFPRLLETRLQTMLNSSYIQVVPPPREMDPTILAWKGGSVTSKLKIATEMWIGQVEWDLLGSRVLHSRCLFAF